MKSDVAISLDSSLSNRFLDARLIGKGTSGCVYAARDGHLNRMVAVKEIAIDSDTGVSIAKQVKGEIHLLSRLNHPAILRILDARQSKHAIHLIQPFCSRGTLEDQLAGDNLSMGQSLQIFRKILDATDYLHKRGFIHCDIKPANVLIDERNEPFLSDFGLSRRIDERTQPGLSTGLVGSIGYMAPELLEEKSAPSIQSDIYSLGATLYEVLARERAFQGSNTFAMREAISLGIPKLTSSKISSKSDWNAIIQKATCPEPKERYASVYDFAEDVKAVLNHQPISAKKFSNTTRIQKWIRREPITAGLFGCIALSLLAGVICSGLAWWSATNQLQITLSEQEKLKVLTAEVAEIRLRLEESLNLARLATEIAAKAESEVNEAMAASTQLQSQLEKEIKETSRLSATSTKIVDQVTQDRIATEQLATQTSMKEGTVLKSEKTFLQAETQRALWALEETYWRSIGTAHEQARNLDWDKASASLSSSPATYRGFEYYVLEAIIRKKTFEPSIRQLGDWKIASYLKTEKDQGKVAPQSIKYASGLGGNPVYAANISRNRIDAIDLVDPSRSSGIDLGFPVEGCRDLRVVVDPSGNKIGLTAVYAETLRTTVFERNSKGRLAQLHSSMHPPGEYLQGGFFPETGFAILHRKDGVDFSTLMISASTDSFSLWSEKIDNKTPISNPIGFWAPQGQLIFCKNRTQMIVVSEKTRNEIKTRIMDVGEAHSSYFVDQPSKLPLRNRFIDSGFDAALGWQISRGNNAANSSIIFRWSSDTGKYILNPSGFHDAAYKSILRIAGLLPDGSLLISRIAPTGFELLFRIDYGITQTNELKECLNSGTPKEISEIISRVK